MLLQHSLIVLCCFSIHPRNCGTALTVCRGSSSHMASVGGSICSSTATRDNPIYLLCMSITKVKERRIVHTQATRHVIPVLEKFLSEFNPSSAALVLHKGVRFVQGT